MVALSLNFKRLIIIIILVLSIFMGIRFSDFNLKPHMETTVETREADRVFKNAVNIKKTRMLFTVNNFREAQELYNEIADTEEIKKFYHTSSSNNLVSVIEAPPHMNEEVIGELRKIPGLESERTETHNVVSMSPADVRRHLEQNEYLLRRYRSRLDSPYLTTRELGELQGELRDIQAKIDSLNQVNNIISEQEKQNHLIFSVIRKSSKPTIIEQVLRGVYFIAFTVVSFLVITLLALVVFLGADLLSRLMLAVGIESKRHSSLYSRYGKRIARRKKKDIEGSAGDKNYGEQRKDKV